MAEILIYRANSLGRASVIPIGRSALFVLSAWITVCVPLNSTAIWDSQADNDVTIVVTPADDARPVIAVKGLAPELLDDCRRMISGKEDVQPREVLTLRRVEGDPGPPVLGSYSIRGEAMVFTPRYPLQKGITFVVAFDPRALNHAVDPVTKRFTIPPDRHPPPTVTAVYPSGTVLPENLLRLYVHFSAPMRRGDIYRYIHLREVDGKEIELPFLEIDQELWSRDGKRLTLLFDPGRIKRGLRPREEVGPILERGKSYELVIDHRWPDTHGTRLARQFVARFRAGVVDDQQPDPKRWTIHTPARDTADPLEIDFAEPLDHAMIQRVIRIEDSQGQSLPGRVEVADEERRWKFFPQDWKWQSGRYEIVVSTELEDRAGNSIRRQFDVDVFEQTEPPNAGETIRIPVRVK